MNSASYVSIFSATAPAPAAVGADTIFITPIGLEVNDTYSPVST